MELNEMHVGQTVFRNGERNKPCKVTAIGEELFMGKGDGIGESAYHAEYYQPIPRDLHDKDGKPLKMGDKYTAGRSLNERKVCGCVIPIYKSLCAVDETGHLAFESDIAKVEPVETVDDVRLYVNSYDWSHSSAERVQLIIDSTVKAVRAEYER